MKKALRKQTDQKPIPRSRVSRLILNIESLRFRLAEAEDTLDAMRKGKVDALVINTPSGNQVYTLKGADYTYRAIVEHMNEGTITVNKDGMILYSNRQFAKLVKAPLEQVIGSSLYAHIAEEYRLALKERLRKNFQVSHILEIMIKAKDDSTIPSRVSISSLEKYDIPAVCLVFTDLTVQKQAEELRKALQQLEVIFQNVTDAITVQDNKGVVIYANKQAAIFSGFSSGDELLKSSNGHIYKRLELFYESGKPFSRKKFPTTQALKGKENIEETYFYRNKLTQAEGWINVKGVPVFDEKGRVRFAIAVTQDVTGQKKLEQQKNTFIGIASHELKTPVTSMKAYAQLLEKRFANRGDKKDAYFLSNMNQQADRLTKLINDLLNVSKIDSGKLALELSVFDLDELVSKVLKDSQYTNETHALIKDGQLTRPVIGDANRIEQVITNLITNAIKYSPQADKIMVTLGTKGNKALVSVRDFGYGVAKRDQKRIFERFYRTGDKERSKIAGFGLGLYISSEIIKRHKCKLWVESKKGKGSTFCFTLPLGEKEREKSAE